MTIRATDLDGQTYDEAIVLDVTDIASERRLSAGDRFQINVDEEGIPGQSADGRARRRRLRGRLDRFRSQPQRRVDSAMLRLYNSAGNPVSGEIVLGNKTSWTVYLTPLANGGLIVAREAAHEPLGTFSVKAQAYDSVGNPVGPEMTAGSSQSGYVGSPIVIELSDGGYIMAFGPANTWAVHGQRFTAAGIPTGAEFTIATNPMQTIALVAMQDGGFLASWVSIEEAEGGEAVVQRFNSAGAPAGQPFTVPLGPDPGPVDLIALAGGGYVFTWVEWVGEEFGLSLFALKAQLIAPDGSADGEPLVVAGYVAESDDVGEVTFAAHPDGGFVATWPMIAVENGLIVYGVRGQSFDDRGSPVGEAFQVTAIGYGSDVTVLADGAILGTWHDQGETDAEAFARILRLADGATDPGTDDVLTGDGEANRLDGMNGNDQLYGLGGNDELIGGSGNDRLEGGTGANSVDGGAGDDIIYSVNLGVDMIQGGTGNDVAVIDWSAQALAFSTVASGDVAFGNFVDTAATLTGVEVIRIATGSGADSITTLGGDDEIRTGAGNDYLNGAGGNDYLDGGSGDDMMTGGAGNDVYVVSSAGDSVSETPGSGTDEIRTSLAAYSLASLADVENLTGTSTVRQTLSGNSGDNVVTGGSGSDILIGGAGSDTLKGGAGGDRLYSHGQGASLPGFGEIGSADVYAEADVLIGGDNGDFFFAGYGDSVDGGAHDSYDGDHLYLNLAGAPGGVVADFRLLQTQPSVTVGGAVIANVENVVVLQGTDFADVLALWHQPFTSPGVGGWVFGYGGDDHLVAGHYSGWGDSALYGGDGNDTIDLAPASYSPDAYGEAGDDLIIGGSGYESLFGGNRQRPGPGHVRLRQAPRRRRQRRHGRRQLR